MMKANRLLLKSLLLFIIFGLTLVVGCKKDDDIDIRYQETVTDVDGNVYKTVLIGSQIWMAENLKVTKYRDGSEIPNVKDSVEWVKLTSGACCDYKNDTAISSVYGKLYNFYTIKDSRNICPVGWHIPTNEEWTTLINSVGGENVAGGKLKETGTLHWSLFNDNVGATDSRGFTALPSGSRSPNGGFYDINVLAIWWSSTEQSTDSVKIPVVYCSYSEIYRLVTVKAQGISVRCVKD